MLGYAKPSPNLQFTGIYCHCEEERRSNRMDWYLVRDFAIATLHFVTLAMTCKSYVDWDVVMLIDRINYLMKMNLIAFPD
jgi:hypothetical protein